MSMRNPIWTAIAVCVYLANSTGGRYYKRGRKLTPDQFRMDITRSGEHIR